MRVRSLSDQEKGAPSTGAPVILLSQLWRLHGIVIELLVPAERVLNGVTSVAVTVQVPEVPK